MDEQLELRHLRYFVAVAQELHFGKAALRLHMAQPPLSQQIKKLETLLGCALFVRTSRAVNLTDAGSALLERSLRILARVRDDIDSVRRVGRGETGILRVGFVGSAMLTKLPKTLHEYQRLYPDVHLQLQELYSAAILDGLQQHTIDIGIVRDGETVESLETTPILHEPFIAILPAQHPLAKQPRVRISQLRDEPFVFYPQSAGRTAWDRTMQVWERNGSRPRVVQEAPHWVTIVSLVGAGIGVSIAPGCVRKITGGDVVSRPLVATKNLSCLELVHRRNENSPVVHSFAAIVRKVFASRREI
jgi:DNA-binding transcriptional LysR family regulator